MVSLSLPSWLPIVVLGAALLGAVWNDVRSRRIPNLLVAVGSSAGLLLHAVMPAGAGLFSAPVGSLGVIASLSGFALGLALLLPFYALRTLGAGDVKLMAMVGAFLGPTAIAGAILATMLVGGVLALGAAAWQGRLRLLFSNLYMMLVTRSHHQSAPSVDGTTGSAGSLPYAIAIASGTAIQLFRLSH